WVTSSRERWCERESRSLISERVTLSLARLTLTVEDACSVAQGMGMSAKGCSFGESIPEGASLSIIPFTRVARGSTTREFPLRRLARKNRWVTLFTLRLRQTYLHTRSQSSAVVR